jgi:hypothetical protein
LFDKRSQIEFAQAKRLVNNDLGRWQLNAVDMPISESYQIFVASWERAKHRYEDPPEPGTISVLE